MKWEINLIITFKDKKQFNGLLKNNKMSFLFPLKKDKFIYY